MIGQTLSHYKILRRAGSGGMGAVYVAEDSRLRREVALKLLPPEMAGDPDRRGRFEREARVVASLNHPHIVTIYSVEESDGIHFLTMELIEGGTLSELIPESGFSLKRFFELAIPLVDAVSAAHRRGITHRDLKPDNIMMSAEGRLKVCDFGIAKLAEATPEPGGITNAPTIAQTEAGSVLGTVAYMSPEQAEAKKVDERSDIFSLGIVLYELATGRLPFTGDSRAAVVSSILRDTPPSVCEQNHKLPRQLGRIIHRCLAKEPIRRFQTSIDLHNELEELKAEVESGLARPLGGAHPPASVRPPRRIGRAVAWLLVPAAIAASAAASLLIDGRVDTAARARDGIIMGRFDQLTDAAGEELFPSLSPDGKTLAFTSREAGNWDVYVQRVGGINPMNLTADSPARDTQPVFSPDGEWIAFRSDRAEPGLYMMGATGESVRRLARGGYYPSWSPGGDRIVYSTLDFTSPLARGVVSSLRIVEVATGDLTDLATPDAIQPHWSPGGHRIAYWGLVEGTGQRDIWTIAPDGSDQRPVTQDAHVDWNPVWSHDGRHILFVSDRGGTMNLWRVAVDEKTGEVQGEPRPVTTEVSAWSGYPSISRDGTRIAYVSESQTANVQRIAIDLPSHRVVGQPAWVTRGAGEVKACDPSPDGAWMACARGGRQEDVFLVRPDGSDRRMVTNDPHRDRYPRWSPDGGRLAFFSDRNGSWEIWSVSLDGSELRQLTDTPGRSGTHPVWSPDGTRMLVQFTDERSGYIFDPGQPWTSQTPEPIPPVAALNGWFAAWSWSPDGRRLAGTIYEMRGADMGMGTYTLETGQFEPLGAGGLPVWLPDSRTLIWATAGTLNLIDTTTRKTSQLIDIAPDIIDPLSVRVSRKDGSITFCRSTPEANIWLLNVQ